MDELIKLCREMVRNHEEHDCLVLRIHMEKMAEILAALAAAPSDDKDARIAELEQDVAVMREHLAEEHSRKKAWQQRAYDAAPSAAPGDAQTVPDGWKSVPVEPTTGMLRALCNSMGEEGKHFAARWALGPFREDYQSMLAAAPAVPSGDFTPDCHPSEVEAGRRGLASLKAAPSGAQEEFELTPKLLCDCTPDTVIIENPDEPAYRRYSFSFSDLREFAWQLVQRTSQIGGR
jgi:hypothetical protein